MQYVSRTHHYIGIRRHENNGLWRIGVPGQISRGAWGEEGVLWVAQDPGSSGPGKLFAYWLPPRDTLLSAITFSEITPSRATVNVWLANPAGEEQTVYLRDRTLPETSWNDPLSARGVDRVTFRLAGLNARSRLEVQASLDRAFPDGGYVTVEFVLRPSDRDLHLTNGNFDPAGIWCNGETMYVLDDGDRRIYAYNMATGTPDGNLGFELHDDHDRPRGVFASPDTMWVAGRGGPIYAYTIQTGTSYGQRDETKEFVADTDDGYPSGIWSDGSLMWVVNYVDEEVFAFDVSANGTLGSRASDSDFSLATHYSTPLGMWSDGDTFWVVDSRRDRLFAYADDTRQPVREIKLVDDNASPWGVCSVDDVLYVADRGHDRIYAYFEPPKPSGDITGIRIKIDEDRKATITVEFNNLGSSSKSVKLRYGVEPDGETIETDATDTNGTEAEFTLSGLSRDTAYRLAAILGDETLATGGFRAWSRTDTVRRHLKVRVVERYQEDFPWIRETYRKMRRLGRSVSAASLEDAAGVVWVACGESSNELHWCSVNNYTIDHAYLKDTNTFVHELAHVWTIGSDYMRQGSEFRGMGWLYMASLARGGNNCNVHELYADGITKVIRTRDDSSYYADCSNTPNSPSNATKDVARSVMADQIPTWFVNQYESNELPYDTSILSNYDRMYDLEQVWSDVKRAPSWQSRPAAVYAFRSAFGGYCDQKTAHRSAHHRGPVRNPWKAGGCVPQAVEAQVLAGGSVAWDEPAYDGGAPIAKYVVDWKSPEEEFDASRSVEITDLTDLTYRDDAFELGTMVRIRGHNIHGGGETTTVEITGEHLGAVTVSPTVLEIDEGDSGTYSVQLEAQPKDDVTITVTVPAGADATVTPSSLTFTSENWNTPKQVSITAGQDADSIYDVVTISHAVATGSPTEYLAVSVADVVLTIRDDELLGVATLSDLQLSSGTLTPAFGSGTLQYTASVAHDVEQVTVTATKTRDEISVTYLDKDGNELTDADAMAEGFQFTLRIDENIIQVQVTSENGNNTQSYIVTVTRPTDPTICTPNAGDFWCGVVTVAEFSLGSKLGTLRGYHQSHGSLSNNVLTHDGTNHTVKWAHVVTEADTFSRPLGTFEFSSNQMIPRGLTLRAGAAEFSTSRTDLSYGAANEFVVAWHNSGLSWSVGDYVTLRLSIEPAAPGRPTNLTADAVGQTQIDLSWTAPENDGNSAITGYRIEVSSDVGSSWNDLVSDTGSTDTTYSHTGLAANTTRHYRVYAINAVGSSNASNTADDATLVPSGPNIAPTFDSESTTRQVPDNSPTDTNVGTPVTAQDAQGDRLTYSLEGTDAGSFDIEPDTGQIYTVTGVTYDYEAKSSYEVTVRATDPGRLFDTIAVRIDVTIVSEGVEGEFRLNPYTEQHYEDQGLRRYAGKQSRLEAFHADRWGTVCDDRFKGSDDTNHPSFGNLASSLACQAMGYDDGEYASGYGTSEGHQPDEDWYKYVKPGSAYPETGPLPIWLDDLMCWERDKWPFTDDPTPDYLRLKYLENPGDPENQTMTPYLCAHAGWGLHNGTHQEDAGVRCWYDTQQSNQNSDKALKGRFLSTPDKHDGSQRVKVRVAFSEPIDETPEGLREHGVRVEGGEVTAVHREVGQLSTGTRSVGGTAAGEVVWVIEIQPTSAADLTLSLDGGRPCHEAGAICTADGRTLLQGISTTVRGPSSLTASFKNVPETHDGATEFTFRVAFSEDIGISYQALREDAFTVSRGTVTRGRRVDNRRDLFEITIQPDSLDAVVITLPAGRDCGVSGAICTKGENRQQLTNSPSATVAGPPNTAAEGAPTIGGTPQVDEELTASTSGISDGDGLENVSFTHQWLADDTAIQGATNPSYIPIEADEGKAIKVSVSFTDDAGNGETLTSAATDAVTAAAQSNSPAMGTPVITGTPQVGETLTVDTSGIADEDGLTNDTFSYRWLADDAEISGATGSTYTLTGGDEGKAITVQASFTDDAGNNEALTSAATGAVSAAEPTEPPAKPTGLSATASHDSVTLTWDDPGDDSITGYVILRRVRENDVGGEFSELVPDTGSTATTYTDDTVVAGITYTYRIKAINGAGTSERSRWFHIDTPAAPVPHKPTSLSATATHDSVTLTWNDPNDDSITGYMILRRLRHDDPSGHFDELVADTGTAATTYTDDTVKASTSYTYRIKAINGAGTSERSRWFHIDTPAAPDSEDSPPK